MRVISVFCIMAFGFSVSIAQAATRHVNASNPSPAPPYTNWATAATTIQDAIQAASSGDEILVAPGEYLATPGAILIPADKPLTLRSTQRHAAIVDAQRSNRCFTVEGAGSRIEGFVIQNGVAGGGSGGGGVFLATNSLLLDCIITTCQAASSGGGIHAYAGSVISNCVVVSNQATSGAGALLGPGVVMQGCRVAKNTATGYGAGIVLYEAGTLRDCIIEGNRAENLGGGVAFSVGSTGLVENCVIRNNWATGENGSGGGVCIQKGGRVERSWIHNNLSAYQGGGVSMYREEATDADISLVNCVLHNNYAGNHGGGAYSFGWSNHPNAIVNCTIADNIAGHNAGGVYAHATRLINNILYFNTATSSSNDNLYADQTTQAGWIQNCCTTTDYDWPNITSTPSFVDRSNRNYRLATASFCIDAGTTNGAPSVDIDGNPRPRTGMPGMSPARCDIGAHEYGFHFNSFRLAGPQSVQFSWDVQDDGRYQVDIATNAATNPENPDWSTIYDFINTTILWPGNFSNHTATITNPTPPMPRNAIFRLRVGSFP